MHDGMMNGWGVMGPLMWLFMLLLWAWYPSKIFN